MVFSMEAPRRYVRAMAMTSPESIMPRTQKSDSTRELLVLTCRSGGTMGSCEVSGFK